MHFTRFRATCSLLGALLLPIANASAGIVDYTATALGGNFWRYDYTVNNTTPGIAFDELTLYFGVGSYGALSLPSAPVGWDPIVVQPDSGIPSDGFYDVINLAGYLAAGESVSGFSVVAEWLGTGAPSTQAFELIDASTFTVVASGETTLARIDAQDLPEPASLSLALLGLGALATRCRAGGRKLLSR